MDASEEHRANADVSIVSNCECASKSTLESTVQPSKDWRAICRTELGMTIPRNVDSENP
jgi:hypothetical protein